MGFQDPHPPYYRVSQPTEGVHVGRVGRDLVKDGIWSSSSTVLLISLLERPSSRTRSGLSDRPLMSTDGRDGQD